MNNTCPSCGSVYGVSAQHVGRQFNCRKCNAALVVAEDGLQLAGAATQRVDASEAAAEEEHLSDTARVAPRPRRGRTAGGGLGDYLTFRKFIVPLIIQIIFWLFAALSIIAGLGMLYLAISQKLGLFAVLEGLFVLVAGPLMVRIYCEILIVIFRIHDTLTDVKNAVEKK